MCCPKIRSCRDKSTETDDEIHIASQTLNCYLVHNSVDVVCELTLACDMYTPCANRMTLVGHTTYEMVGRTPVNVASASRRAKKDVMMTGLRGKTEMNFAT